MTNNPQLENGYTKIANEIIDQLCRIKLSSYQMRVLLFVFRKTYGYNKKEDWISVSQIEEATGIYKAHVSRAKKELLQRKIVTSNGNKIAFQKDSRLWCELPRMVTVTKTGNIVTNPGQKVTILGQKLPVQVDTKDNIQNTITKERESIERKTHTIKFSTIESLQESDLQEIADKYMTPLSFVKDKLDDMVLWAGQRPNDPKIKNRNWKLTLISWVKRDRPKESEVVII